MLFVNTSFTLNSVVLRSLSASVCNVVTSVSFHHRLFIPIRTEFTTFGFSDHCVPIWCRVKCGVRDAGNVWKSKVQGIRCGAKVRGNV